MGRSRFLRMGVPGGGGWTPAHLPNILLWVNAGAGTFEDVDRTVAAVDDADIVLGWRDLSPIGTHLSQLDSKVVLKTNIQNGRSALRGNDSNAILRSAAGAAGTITSFHLFIVGNSGNSNSVADAWIGASSGVYGGANSYFALENTGGHHYVYIGSSPTPASVYRGGGSLYPEIMEIKFIGSTSISLTINGYATATQTTGVPASLNLTSAMDLLAIVSSSTIVRGIGGDIFETVVVKNRILSDSERSSVLNYISRKYNIALYSSLSSAGAIEASATYDAFPRTFSFADDIVCVLARRGTDHVTAADGTVVQWRSTNAGVSFGASATLIGGAGSDYRDPSGGVVPATNTGIMWVCDLTPTPHVNHCLRTTDSGENWTDVAQYSTGGNAAYAFGPLVIMPSGKIRQTFYDGAKVWCLESDDDGLTWTESISTTAALSEPAMACIGGTSDAAAQLILVWRQTGTKALKMASSVDGGINWTDNGEIFVETRTQYDVSPDLLVSNGTAYLYYGARKHKQIVRYQAVAASLANNISAWGNKTVLYRLDSNLDADCGYPSAALVGGTIKMAFYDTPKATITKPNIFWANG